MMGPRLKNTLAIGMLLALGLHFLLVLAYAAPSSPGGIWAGLSSRYCYPFFHQQWSVFVPAPNCRFDVMVRASPGQNARPWQRMMSELVSRKQSHPALPGAETEWLLLSNAVSYLASELGDTQRVFTKSPQLPAFDVLERATRYYARHGLGADTAQTYELMILVDSPGEHTRVYYFKNLPLS